MTKILVIGQAPPLRSQDVPYDTTLFYTILQWVGISKEDAQDLFEFEALTDQFPGKNKSGGHKAPSKAVCKEYYDRVLGEKISSASRVILLGACARKFILSSAHPLENISWLTLDHPSRRNYNRIMKNKEKITEKLNNFLK